MKKTIAAVILAFVLVNFMGCNSCSNNVSTKKTKNALERQKDTIEKEIPKHVYPLPTSAEVIKKLTDFEVGYRFGITNPIENVKKYFKNDTRSINLGVFGADLSYVTLYNIMQQVTDYMDVIRILATDLNMAKIYDAALYDSIKVNFDNKDKLVKILTKSFDDTYAYMSDNDQQALALLVVGGAWVEGMYLTTQVSEAAYQVADFSKVLLEQKQSFEVYLDLTKHFMDVSMISDFINKLDPIKKVYSGLGTSLTLEDIKNITLAITKIREEIVK